MKEPRLKNLKINRELTQKIRKSPKASKVRVTIHFDEDLIEKVKKMAQEMSSPYQTLLNRILRDSLLEFEMREDRIRRLEREIEVIKKAVGI